jgi:hypothetical protein
MAEKAKIFYFGVFILVVFAFIFHVTAMGFHHWKKADARNSTYVSMYSINHTNVGLFTRCTPSTSTKEETCFPNLFPNNKSCSVEICLQINPDASCSCGFLPSTKGIAACAIIAAIFLGLAIIILFIHSINTSETRTVGLFLGLLPLILLLLALIFILITLILVGSYLSRDIMQIVQDTNTNRSKYLSKVKRKKTCKLFSVSIEKNQKKFSFLFTVSTF